MVSRFQVDLQQADSVRSTALSLLDQATPWQLAEGDRLLLGRAARLHEIGLSITHNKHHLQGAYILRYADLPGFSRREQIWLALLVQTHRRKIDMAAFDQVPREERTTVIRLCIILRLSVLLHRLRQYSATRNEINVGHDSVHLALSQSQQNNRLLGADLEREQSWLLKAGYNLDLSGALQPV